MIGYKQPHLELSIATEKYYITLDAGEAETLCAALRQFHRKQFKSELRGREAELPGINVNLLRMKQVEAVLDQLKKQGLETSPVNTSLPTSRVKYRCTACGYEQSVDETRGPNGAVYAGSKADFCDKCQEGKPERV